MRIAYSQSPYQDNKTPVLDQAATVNLQPSGGATLTVDGATPTGSVASVQPDGSWELRGPGTAGPYEVFFGVTAAGGIMSIRPNDSGGFGTNRSTYEFPYAVIG